MTPKQLYGCFCVGFCALAVLMALGTRHFDYRINASSSLPGTLYVIHKNAPIQRGDLVAFRWHGGGHYAEGVVFIKRASGMPGDVVKREGRRYWVNGSYVGAAKVASLKGVPLEAALPGVIGAGQVFVATPSMDSLDSRYAITGNIQQQQIVGRAYAIF